MTYQSAIKFLYSLTAKKYNLRLTPIRTLLKKLGNPHKNLKIIHVAGTNGKGSTCAMISSILQAAGYKVGMYTSPHLTRFNERFKINNKDMSDKDVVKYYKKVKKVYHGESFFELVTAMAFVYFFEKRVDYLVLEVGLGGRLDATNVCLPLVAIITNIGLEHQEYLGDTIKKIAFEKAGIIKKNNPIVTGTSGVALQVILQTAKKRKALLYVVDKDGKNLKLHLKGEFQKHNALMAIKAASLIKDMPNAVIQRGLLTAEWPGRLKYIQPNILVDCAHNLDAVKVLLPELRKIQKPKILVVGILTDKNYAPMLKLLQSAASVMILTQPHTERATDPKELAKYVNSPLIIPDVADAVKAALKLAGRNSLVVITGSIYTVGEAITAINSKIYKQA